MMTPEDAVRAALEAFYRAVHQLQRGDPAPMLALWSHGADVTHLGPGGGWQRGWEQVRSYYEQAARLAAASPAAVSAAAGDIAIQVEHAWAYTSGSERVQVTRDGQTTHFTPRATHIYRLEADRWKLRHRHADAAPDVSGGPAARSPAR